MAKQRFIQSLENLLKSALRLDQTLTPKDRFWLWRSSLISHSPGTQAGFILPTVTLLLLMLSLILGILIFRTGNRTNQVIGQRQQRQVYNAATPAIERAKAKLEYLFTEESIPVLPSEGDIESTIKSNARYTLPDETRLNIATLTDGSETTSGLDNAWVFNFDSQGKENDTSDDVKVVYSIVSRASRIDGAQTIKIENDDQDKANSLVVRTGPINLSDGAGNPACDKIDRSPYQGWQKVTGANLRKAIQVYAIAIPGPDNPNKTAATLEMQQDKQANLGNKWGAWFRNDMEIAPGTPFRWNGAMNTAGSYFIGSGKISGKSLLELYPVSSPGSCVYTKENSVIVTSDITQAVIDKTKKASGVGVNGEKEFQGQFVIGSLRDAGNNAKKFGGEVTIYRHEGYAPGTKSDLIENTNDSILDTTNSPVDIALDPVLLLTEGISRTRKDENPAVYRDGAWKDKAWVGFQRPFNEYQAIPFVDDTYRADNRWGPKPLYSEDPILKTPDNDISDPDLNSITLATVDGTDAEDKEKKLLRLTRDTPPVDNKTDEESYGLDGYWERRAKAQGVRFIVGQRLELGNVNGWITEVDTNQDGVPDIDYNGNGRVDFDPLYPPPANPGVGSTMATRQNELMQWKTLRDNLAAVQSTAVYHYLKDGGEYPVACVATTAHPGTPKTIENSTTFNYLENDPNKLKVDFLNGQGTNGWEFAPMAKTTFESDISSSSSALRTGLRNLAYFSGDPKGAFPPVQDVSGAANAATHPYPIHTMWGDFSNLRRAIGFLENGQSYEDLSLADRTTLQTASCTLGMLAYNVQNVEEGFDDYNDPAWQALRDSKLINNGALYEITKTASNNGKIPLDSTTDSNYLVVSDAQGEEIYRGATSSLKAYDTTAPARSVPPDVLIDALPPEITEDERNLLKRMVAKEQVNRDRLMGFATQTYPIKYINDTATGTDGNTYGRGRSASGASQLAILGVSGLSRGQAIPLQCDYKGSNYFGLGEPTTAAQERDFLALAFTFCPRAPKYPSLFYLFPKYDHDQKGEKVGCTPGSPDCNFTQPEAEPYTSEGLELTEPLSTPPSTSDFNNEYGITTNTGVEYKVVDNANQGIGAIALSPRSSGAWQLPSGAGSAAQTVNKVVEITSVGTRIEHRTTLLDKAIFDGRQHMGVRVLDLDLDLLRRTQISGTNELRGKTATDYWMPLPEIVDPQDSPTRTGAAFYAFREDALREDGIARPKKVNPDEAAWKTAWRAILGGTANANYRMNAAAFGTTNEQDPPVNPLNGLSPKPVDFYADPARRPHGFRLKNGSDLTRVGAPVEDARGISFISDNAVYIQGNFNLHSDNGTAQNIEEFLPADKLNADWGNFYDRTQLNEKFADSVKGDRWRASEVVADAVTFLSNAFTGDKDGSVSQGIRQPAATTSFHALNFPKDTATLAWVREDGFVYPDNATVAIPPIKISKRGFPVYCLTAPATPLAPLPQNNPPVSRVPCATVGYLEKEYGVGDNRAFISFKKTRNQIAGVSELNRNGKLITAQETFINSLIVSGTIPSRSAQSNGGLHNFPRLIENWEPTNSNGANATNLWFSGSLFQLNFNTSATAPYDQDSWEPTENPDANNEYWSTYYWPAGRRWGYDVALQYVQPSPVANRFAGRSNIRSEFYRELPVDDPYISLLRCAVPDGGSFGQEKIDPTAACN